MLGPQTLYTDSQMFLRRGEARTEIRGHSSNTTQTKKCYSWTLVSLRHPPVSSVAVGNHTFTLKLKENYVFAVAAPAVETSFFFQKVFGWYFRKNNETILFPMALLLWIEIFHLLFLSIFCVFYFFNLTLSSSLIGILSLILVYI